jgi:hypothetical protein
MFFSSRTHTGGTEHTPSEESRYFSRKRIDGFELGYKIASIWKFFEMAKLGWICVHAWTVGWSW